MVVLFAGVQCSVLLTRHNTAQHHSIPLVGSMFHTRPQSLVSQLQVQHNPLRKRRRQRVRIDAMHTGSDAGVHVGRKVLFGHILAQRQHGGSECVVGVGGTSAGDGDGLVDGGVGEWSEAR